MKRVLFLFLVFFFVMTSGHITSASGQFPFLPNPHIGKTAPEHMLKKLDGTEVSVLGHIQNKKAIFFFWATWCPYCRVELGRLNARLQEFESQGIKIVLIDVGESADVVESYIKRNDIKFEVLLDTDSSLAEKYNLYGVPTFIFINSQKIVLAVENQMPEKMVEILSVFKDSNGPVPESK